MSAPVLELQGVSRSFGGVKAVQDVSFSVHHGEVLSIIGPNGAGKTTLFNLITGALAPHHGDIRFEGRSILGLRPDQTAALGVGRTFQIVRPFPALTVLDNVALAALTRYPTLAAARLKAGQVLELLHLSHLAGNEARGLPLGLRKRLEIARAVALEPKIILLDEVMAGLNPAEVDQTVAVVKELPRLGIAAVAGVEHVLRAVMKISDRIVVINTGQKLTEGPPEQVVRNPEVVRAYLGSYFEPTAAGEIPQ